MEGRSAWVIFDADNTLWAVECLYDDARNRMCAYLASNGIDPADAERFQRQRDKELHATYGYSACRFARSFEDTILHFRANAPAAGIRHVRQLALAVFEERAAPAEGLEETLAALTQNHYLLAIITAGEPWVQKRRLEDFHLRDDFATIEVVESKNADVLREFCLHHQVDPSASWMVGDSINSDIVPATQAGLRAVLVETPNWDVIEGAREQLPSDVPVIRSLRDLPSVIIGA